MVILTEMICLVVTQNDLFFIKNLLKVPLSAITKTIILYFQEKRKRQAEIEGKRRQLDELVLQLQHFKVKKNETL